MPENSLQMERTQDCQFEAAFTLVERCIIKYPKDDPSITRPALTSRVNRWQHFGLIMGCPEVARWRGCLLHLFPRGSGFNLCVWAGRADVALDVCVTCNQPNSVSKHST